MSRAHALNPAKPGWTLCDLDIGGAQILDSPVPFARLPLDPEIERCPACLAATGMSGLGETNLEQLRSLAAAARSAGAPDLSPTPVALPPSALYVLTVTRHHYDSVVATTVFVDGAAAAAAYRAAIEDYLADLLEDEEDMDSLVAANTAPGCTATFDPSTDLTATYFCGEEGDDPVIRLIAVPRPAGLSLSVPSASDQS